MSAARWHGSGAERCVGFAWVKADHKGCQRGGIAFGFFGALHTLPTYSARAETSGASNDRLSDFIPNSARRFGV